MQEIILPHTLPLQRFRDAGMHVSNDQRVTLVEHIDGLHIFRRGQQPTFVPYPLASDPNTYELTLYIYEYEWVFFTNDHVLFRFEELNLNMGRVDNQVSSWYLFTHSTMTFTRMRDIPEFENAPYETADDVVACDDCVFMIHKENNTLLRMSFTNNTFIVFTLDFLNGRSVYDFMASRNGRYVMFACNIPGTFDVVVYVAEVTQGNLSVISSFLAQGNAVGILRHKFFHLCENGTVMYSSSQTQMITRKLSGEEHAFNHVNFQVQRISPCGKFALLKHSNDTKNIYDFMTRTWLPIERNGRFNQLCFSSLDFYMAFMTDDSRLVRMFEMPHGIRDVASTFASLGGRVARARSRILQRDGDHAVLTNVFRFLF